MCWVQGPSRPNGKAHFDPFWPKSKAKQLGLITRTKQAQWQLVWLAPSTQPLGLAQGPHVFPPPARSMHAQFTSLSTKPTGKAQRMVCVFQPPRMAKLLPAWFPRKRPHQHLQARAQHPRMYRQHVTTIPRHMQAPMHSKKPSSSMPLPRQPPVLVFSMCPSSSSPL